jgi:hypothetical protein
VGERFELVADEPNRREIEQAPDDDEAVTVEVSSGGGRIHPPTESVETAQSARDQRSRSAPGIQPFVEAFNASHDYTLWVVTLPFDPGFLPDDPTQ